MYGRDRPNSCRVNVRNRLDFELYLGFGDAKCGVRQERPGRFSTDVVIQVWKEIWKALSLDWHFSPFSKHHDMIVTSDDVGLKIRCNYNLSNRTVSNVDNLAVSGGLNKGGAENTVVRSPNVTLRVTDRYNLILSSLVTISKEIFISDWGWTLTLLKLEILWL